MKLSFHSADPEVISSCHLVESASWDEIEGR